MGNLKEFRQVNETDKDKVLSYLKRFTEHPGSIHEEDFFSQLISGLVEQLKIAEQKESNESNSKEEIAKREAVLIIDDLDRIDPEHIFRIMNVLTSHVDVKKDVNQNKFDFDKIILVCDIENIRKIFANRYGADVDFSGYIDKFYSRSIFHYDLSTEMMKSIDKLFHTVVLDYGNKKTSLREVRKDVAGAIIKQILYSFTQFNLISIRTLKRIFSGGYILKERYIWKIGKYDSLTNNDIELVKSIDYLVYLFQDYDMFIEKCRYLIGRDTSNHFFMNELLKAASFKDYYQNVQERPKESGQELEFEVIFNELNFKYRIDKTFINNSLKDVFTYRINCVLDASESEVNIESLNFFELLVSLLEQKEFRTLLDSKFEME